MTLHSGDTVPADGWITCYNIDGITPVIKINGVRLSGANAADAQDCVGGAIPVSSGDKVTFTVPEGHTDGTTCEFYPCK